MKNKKAVIVCTDKLGVIFGWMAPKAKMPQIRLEKARFALYWAQGGIASLAEFGPREGDRIGATIPAATYPDVHTVFEVSDAAAIAWTECKTYVR